MKAVYHDRNFIQMQLYYHNCQARLKITCIQLIHPGCFIQRQATETTAVNLILSTKNPLYDLCQHSVQGSKFSLAKRD